ncbi:hypothetical protein KKD19_00645 [Patescibacteria group bacterium]|nr:hypothetical protein [Patescibacteria group bacterium]MBU4511740.1 hypothetical protein [Patescibacteria group bacterium]MCG2692821.1 hypothetical protein [Candidatus Parcubacteria bacterium]
MKFVNGEPIARVFTNDFRKRTGFSNDKASLLIDRMRDIVMYAHERDALLIDANELGYFVVNNNSQEPEPRIIDVDCWVIDDKWPPSCPIMPSIRDWHVRQGKQWNEGTDWFAWGVVTFQVYTGIHPYKGTLIGYKRNELERRMRDNASVFTNNVRLNKAVRDFSCIPGHLLDWYVATFQSGERTIPPSPFETGVATTQVARVLHAITTATGILVFDKLLGKIGVQVIRFFPCGVALLESGKLIDVSKSRQIGIAQSRDCEIVKVQNGWLKTDLEDGNIRFFHINEVSLDEKEMTLNLNGHQLLRYGNRLFVVTDRGLTEMTLKVLGKPILSVGQTWGVMINSTRWFDGVGIQDTMGATYVIAPFSDNSCAQIRVRELDGLKPIMAKAGNRFITVIALDGNGVYQKIELTMDRGYSSYKVWQEATDSPDLNIAILPKGVCATIVNDGELDIFVPTSGTFNKIQDKYVLTDMALANWENKVVYIQNGELWSVRMSGK